MSKPPGNPGDVVWHLHNARSWRRLSWMFLVLAVWSLVSAVVSPVRPAVAFYVLLAFACGDRFRFSRQKARASLAEAWHIETTQTLQGMADSGLYTTEEAFEAMRNGPLPPGVKRKEWVAWHDEGLERWRRERGE